MGKVSNPLRLEGNAGDSPSSSVRCSAFLIHYGWRGTRLPVRANSPKSSFLIHYGWRGTVCTGLSPDRRALVSNPLRLEGNESEHVRNYTCHKFLIHYGWRGTLQNLDCSGGVNEFLIHYGWRGTIAAISLRLSRCLFLIHYGWRGTFRDFSHFRFDRSFLIHYGWRGTKTIDFPIPSIPVVSNPLRLEGN